MCSLCSGPRRPSFTRRHFNFVLCDPKRPSFVNGLSNCWGGGLCRVSLFGQEDSASPEDTATLDCVVALCFAKPGGPASPTGSSTVAAAALAHTVSVKVVLCNHRRPSLNSRLRDCCCGRVGTVPHGGPANLCTTRLSPCTSEASSRTSPRGASLPTSNAAGTSSKGQRRR